VLRLRGSCHKTVAHQVRQLARKNQCAVKSRDSPVEEIRKARPGTSAPPGTTYLLGPLQLARISHGPVRNAHGVPIRHWRIGASREGFRPGKLLSKQLATGDLLTS